MKEKRLQELQEIISGYDDLSEMGKGILIGTIATVFASYPKKDNVHNDLNVTNK